ncbi:MAG: molybdopterin cofactor-binding domain-containing protein [Pseudomonadota bacterium]
MINKDWKNVGHSVKKVDGYALAAGKPMFVDDIELRGMLYGKILYSPHAHAIIKRIDTAKAEALPGVHAVVDFRSVPRIVHTTAGQGYPEPSPYDTFVFDKKVRFVGDRVAAVAAETEEIAIKALSLIEVDYEVLDAVLDLEKAMDDGAPIIHDEEEAMELFPIGFNPKKNIASYKEASLGDFDKAYSECKYKAEGLYKSQYAQHTPIEPHTCITYYDEMGRMIIRTSTQVPFHVRRIVSSALNIPVKNIRVIKPRIGGGFGAKQEVFYEQVAAALTLKSRKPVRLFMTRSEEFVSSRTRHPMNIEVKLGANSMGKIEAMSMKILSNTGAYGSHALTVATNNGSKTLPLYPCDHVYYEATTVYTNLPVGGAYRGYGVTQACLAMECVMDELAHKMNMDPVKLREINHIKTGETTPLFEIFGEGREGVKQVMGSCGLAECLELGAKEINWNEKYSRKDKGPIKRGVGVVALMQGSSIPHIDMGSCFIKMNDDGSFNLNLGATDLGTGSDTIMAQIAADTIGCSCEDFTVYSSDTDMTPFDVGAYASSTTYLTGNAVIKTAEKIKKQILARASLLLDVTEEALIVGDGRVCTSDNKNAVTFADICLDALYAQDQHQIAAVESSISYKSPPPFSAHFAEVEVDTETGFVTVLKYIAAVDCGTPINPQLAEGQTEGGVLNAISYALTEEYVFNDKGKMLNDNFKRYKIFTTRDLPELKTILVPTYEETGPFGAKSVSELCINGAQSVISNAIFNACGIRLKEPPYSPEKVLKALKEN